MGPRKAGCVRAGLSIQHRLNPLHVYCRLRERGLSQRHSLKICKLYGFLVYWVLEKVSIAMIKAGKNET
ncbi:MAG TPA: hypothetical protein HPP41_03405 [Deltaproteobacteria bacterium]|nr:hypothetical protein [Deltaproteobacteria bacterium]